MSAVTKIVQDDQVHIRGFRKNDVPQLLSLMKQLAVFEGYIEDFEISENDLIDLGLRPSPSFSAYVAVCDNALLGYAVCYQLPFTFDLKPTWVLKELYVADAARCLGIGEKLFSHVKNSAKQNGAARLDWLVLPENVTAQKFYRRHGGQPDDGWQRWQIKF